MLGLGANIALAEFDPSSWLHRDWGQWKFVEVLRQREAESSGRDI